MTSPRLLIPVLAAILALGTLWPVDAAHAFLDRILPSTDTKDEFDGRFIDTLTPGAWKPPLEAAMREAAEKSSDSPSSFSFGGSGDDVSSVEDKIGAKNAIRPEFEEIPGLTMLRMDERGIVVLPALDAYLAGIARRLLEPSPITGAPITVYVTASERYGEAKALPDGTIAIPMASILQADSEDELAALLAHEISHVLRGHHDLDWFEQRQGNLVSGAELMLGLASGLAQQVGKGNEMAAKAARILIVAEATMAATSKGLFPSWTREHEDEADLLGLDLLIAAGYNYDGMFTLMQKMEEAELIEASKPDPYQEARKALEEEIQQQTNQGNIGAALGNVLQAATLEFGTALDRASADHRSATDRLASIRDYFDREYADEIPPAMTALPLEQVRKSREFMEFAEAYKDASKALDLATKGELSVAEKAARSAVSGPYKNHAWTRYAFYKVRLEQGHRDRAMQNLELALNDPYVPLSVYTELEKMNRKAGSIDSAARVLASAWEEFQRPAALYPPLIHHHQRKGEKARAQELAIECAFKNREVAKICRTAAEGRDPDMARTQSWLQALR
ncbi:M48 family metallopeptidase [Oceanibaculum indicum]|uniref:Putative Zn-dependent protease n=1 Tax=Oceanibaculum indicum TaxID=526216 RepID=A0A420WPC8_9PROT|nr:M48 family metallopeptidase [Oceanibaculum indicum]RKQ72898.1 putative Zn-dependent protease [Oceanibaculum indicum]